SPMFFAFLIAYMLDPVVDAFERRGWPRAAGIGVMLTLVLGALVMFILFAVPAVVTDVAGFIEELPLAVETLLDRVTPWLNGLGINVPGSLSEAIEQLQVDTGA